MKKAFVKRGEVNLKLENYDESVRDFEKAHQLDSSNTKSPPSLKNKKKLKLTFQTGGFDVREKLKNAKLELKKSKRKDYYKILCISKEGTEAEIKKAYKKLALKWHPDKNTQDEESIVRGESVDRY